MTTDTASPQELTQRQQAVVDLLLNHGLSTRGAASRLGINQKSVWYIAVQAGLHGDRRGRWVRTQPTAPDPPPPVQPATESQSQQIVRLILGGRSANEIAPQLGLSRDFVQKQAHEAGLRHMIDTDGTRRWVDVRTSTPHVEDGERKKVCALLRGGMSTQQVAARLHLSRRRVRQLAQEGGLTFQRNGQGGQWLGEANTEESAALPASFPPTTYAALLKTQRHDPAETDTSDAPLSVLAEACQTTAAATNAITAAIQEIERLRQELATSQDNRASAGSSINQLNKVIQRKSQEIERLRAIETENQTLRTHADGLATMVANLSSQLAVAEGDLVHYKTLYQEAQKQLQAVRHPFGPVFSRLRRAAGIKQD